MTSSFSIVSLLTRFLMAMAVISELNDDGSSDPPKKPQEDEPKPKRSFTSAIPNAVIETCVAMVPRCQYPRLACVSRYFSILLASSKPYELRLHRNTTESVLYAFIGFPNVDTAARWYILHRIPNQNELGLCRIDSLPHMPYGAAVVTIGHEMYVIGGCDGVRNQTLRVFIIDCRNHTRREIPSMNRARYRAAAGVIDGKIYVIGGFGARFSDNDWIEVFDLETEVWSLVPGPYSYGSNGSGEFATYAVMEEKIYVSDHDSCFSYEPKNGKWETANHMRVIWQRSSCVVDDMLYSFHPLGHVDVYEPKEKKWAPVEGVHVGPRLSYCDAKMANFDGKLMILAASERYTGGENDIWCIEIALERREGGQIWGNIKPVKRVLTSRNSPSIHLCRTVTV